MRSLVPIPAMSSHGGRLFRCSSHNVTVGYGGGSRPCSVYGDLHCCPRKHHGVTRVFSSGFAIAGSRRFTLTYDHCGCGARILTRAANTYCG